MVSVAGDVAEQTYLTSALAVSSGRLWCHNSEARVRDASSHAANTPSMKLFVSLTSIDVSETSRIMGKKSDTAVEHATADGRSDTEDPVLAQIRESLRNLRFGHVQIVVQDGVVVQIDRLERRRITRNERQTSQTTN